MKLLSVVAITEEQTIRFGVAGEWESEYVPIPGAEFYLHEKWRKRVGKMLKFVL